MHLQIAHAALIPERHELRLVADGDVPVDERAGDDRAEAVDGKHAVDGQAERRARVLFLRVQRQNVERFAQGLNATEAWDGTLELSDEISTVAIKTEFEVIKNITEQVAASQLAPQKSGLSDTVGLISFGNPNFVMAVRDYPFIEDVRTKQTCSFVQTDCTESTEYVIAQLKTEFTFEGVAETIDEGQLNVLKIMTSDKREITEIEIGVKK